MGVRIKVGDEYKIIPDATEIYAKQQELLKSYSLINHTHTNTTILPIYSKQFTGVYGSANDFADATFYFGTVLPDSFYKEWHIKYRINASVPNQNNYTGHFEIELWGAQGSRTIYKITNAHYSTSYRTLYNHILYSATLAGFTNGYGHAIGIGLSNSTNPTSSSYPRTFDIDILELDNCSFNFYDSMVKYASIPGTGSTNYSGYSAYDGYNNGLRESGDDNNYHLVHNDIKVYAGSNGIYGSQLIMKDAEEKYQSVTLSRDTATTKSKNTSGFLLGASIFYYSSSTTIASENTTSTWTIQESTTLDFRYSSNCGTTLTAYKPVYLKGTIIDGLFYLADTWWTQALPTTEDGFVYIYLGEAYSTTNIRLVPNHPIYIYKDNRICLYTDNSSQGLNVIDLTNNTFESSNGHSDGTLTSILTSEQLLKLQSNLYSSAIYFSDMLLPVVSTDNLVATYGWTVITDENEGIFEYDGEVLPNPVYTTYFVQINLETCEIQLRVLKDRIHTITGVKGDSESTYRTGNVNITKANIGLGNVENKSSATIRSEITSANVTTALGYTPARLDSTNKLIVSQLPRNSLIEYADALPTTIDENTSCFIMIAEDSES